MSKLVIIGHKLGHPENSQNLSISEKSIFH